MDKIKAYTKKFQSLFKSMSSKGFFHIMIGNTLVKFISFFSAVFLPKVLQSQGDYGVLSFVDNILSYLLLINAFGLANSVLRFCSLAKEQDEKEKILMFSLRLGLLFDAIICIIFIPIILFIQLPIDGSKAPLFFAMFIPLFSFTFDALTYYLRANYKNKEFSRISVVFTLVSATMQVLLAWKFNIFGALAGRYIAYAVAIVVAIYFIMKFSKGVKIESLRDVQIEREQKKEIMKFAISAMIANCFSLIMPLNEQFVISLMLQDEIAVANYRAASLFPQNIQFITNSIIVFIYPYFAKNSYNGKWIWKKYKIITAYLIIGLAAISAVAILATPLIIKIFFSEDYASASGLMKFMWITFSINAGLRMPAGNILAAIGEIKFNLIVSIISSVIHLGLDLFFISTMGINGAAYALTIAYLVSAVISAFFLKWKCNKLEAVKENA